MQNEGTERMTTIITTAMKKKDVAVVLVPKPFARALVDELYPTRVRRAWGFPAMDSVQNEIVAREMEERERYLELVEQGGYVGTFLNVPMFVTDNTVILALSDEELERHAKEHGYDIDGASWRRTREESNDEISRS